MNYYFKVNEKNIIIPCCQWYENIEPDVDWLLGDFTDGILQEEHGISLWKYVNREIVHRTDAEIQADIDAIPVPEPTEIEQLQANIDYLSMENEYFEETVEQQQADIDYLLMLEGES